MYTAFGELVSGTSGRFGYVGAHGYQTAASDTPGDPYAADMPYQHVGARYYDPTTGRFLQRDPIGIRGGPNVYAYVRSTPTRGVDPAGLFDVWSALKWTAKGAVEGIFILLLTPEGEIAALCAAASPVAGLAAGGLEKKDFQPPHVPDEFRDDMHVCFVAGTEVVTAAGSGAIDQITPGDTILTVDLGSKSSTTSRVLLSGVTGHVSELIDVYIDGEHFRSTPGQPYFTVNRGWVEARHLTTNDLLLDMNGGTVPVTAVKRIKLSQPVPVYDIRVEGYHWFFIGKRGILVHNS